MIGVTETTHAYSAAMYQYKDWLEKKYGIRTRLFWETANDERVCLLQCEPLDGQPEGVWKEPPPAHPRCRCKLRMELEKKR